jgi:hypothetical protein
VGIAVAVTVIATGVLKLVDFFAASKFVVRHRDKVVTSDADRTRIDVDWTPVFSWAMRKRTQWKEEGRQGSIRDRLLSIAVDILFRAPALAMTQAALLFVAAGGASGSELQAGCEFQAAGSPSSGLLVAAAAVCVSVAAMGVFSLLLLMFLSPDRDVEVVAGQYPRRLRGMPGDRKPFGPIVVVPVVTLALFLSFAALYLCLFRADPSAFTVAPCSVDAATMIYFSTSIGATVGFGDITASSDAARLIVSCEIIFFVTMLTLFLQTLRLRREEAEEHSNESSPSI